jgi:hypothetical protein
MFANSAAELGPAYLVACAPMVNGGHACMAYSKTPTRCSYNPTAPAIYPGALDVRISVVSFGMANNASMSMQLN